MRTRLSLIALGLLVLTSQANAAERQRVEVVGLSFEVPATWQRTPASGTTKPVAFRLPRADADTVDTQVVLIHYGPAQAKFVKQNLEGWTRLFENPDGGTGADLAKTTTRQVGSLKATLIDLTGSYTGGLEDDGEGKRMAAAGPKRNWRLLGAALEGPPPGPWFWRIIGPARTVSAAQSDFDALIESAKPTQPAAK